MTHNLLQALSDWLRGTVTERLRCNCFFPGGVRLQRQECRYEMSPPMHKLVWMLRTTLLHQHNCPTPGPPLQVRLSDSPLIGAELRGQQARRHAALQHRELRPHGRCLPL
jgi:hypothetical protein